MVERKKAVSTKKKKTGKPTVFDLIEALDQETTQRLLWALAVEDKNAAAKIEKLVTGYFKKIDVEEVAEDVFSVLDFLDVREIGARSGKQRGGYIEPVEAAYEIFEEALDPFRERMKKAGNLSMLEGEKRLCMGILKGIYRFEDESVSEYKNWAADVPSEIFAVILDEWEKNRVSRRDLDEMEEFLEENCPGWEP